MLSATERTRGSQLIDQFAKVRDAIANYFANRPMQIVGTLAGAALFIGILATSLSASNRADLSEVRAAFCNGDVTYNEAQRENCQKLLDQLLKNPTPDQARRLREIVKESQ